MSPVPNALSSGGRFLGPGTTRYVKIILSLVQPRGSNGLCIAELPSVSFAGQLHEIGR